MTGWKCSTFYTVGQNAALPLLMGPFSQTTQALAPEAFLTTSLLDVSVRLLAAGFLAGLKPRSFGIAACVVSTGASFPRNACGTNFSPEPRTIRSRVYAVPYY